MWNPIETAPKDGTCFIARNKALGIGNRKTWWDQGWISRIHFEEWVWEPEEWKEVSDVAADC